MIERFRDAWEDPATRARLLKWMWLISTGFVVFGFVVIFYQLLIHR